MKIDKVHFYEYVLLPGSVNGRALTIFAKDVDTIELLPNGVRVSKGASGVFFFDKAVKAIEYVVEKVAKPAAEETKPLRVEKGKAVKLELDGGLSE